VDEAGRALTVNAQDWSDQVKQRGRLGAWLRGLGIANRTLEAGDLATLLPKLADRLVAKNVAVDVATAITKSLETSLEGTRIGSFQSLETLLEGALVEALRRILRPKVEINVLRAVDAAKQRKRPYVITFCGVNGVGKSTTLSKIAFWLQQNGHSLMIAAGDTFRHGAVEQVMTHGRCLNVPVFHMGYGTDPSEVTKNAVQLAQKQGVDVVLVDTAGRMQDHEPRMRALARLIHENNPDLVLFVGEAIVGNNGVDQLRKFNQCLHDFTPVGREPRGIDGLVLTKFDTINDKVGAAVSMVYELRQPIVFVGVGQTYQDLKTIEPEVVVDALMQ
jgi:signal recognition particle receptor subunit alpha